MALSVAIGKPGNGQNQAVRTVSLEGRLDNESAAQLDQQLLPLWLEPFDLLVFNLARLAYISSMGLRSLFAAQKTMRERQGRTLFVDTQPAVQKVFDIVAAVDVGSVFASAAELDAYLDSMQRRASQSSSGDPDRA
ncbi:STAS domain-containing protein [Cyanobium sp. CH-040]|uniref:STAS domain-containing protein n=1 Tax=Cyanobium sp. CH-040 TaxID=2823708 RepID=UPI0020CCFB58|nr:STAS domain-containing protein [Cyanobium sp. CH-040]MCP9928347.1 STAS domain-containing protein [Cyanobium sp. CH-040]